MVQSTHKYRESPLLCILHSDHAAETTELVVVTETQNKFIKQELHTRQREKQKGDVPKRSKLTNGPLE